ncbi:hypothetical protein Lal_00034580 [Lupinus albus]|nr:hypothetical protein Lal_00034580 [Lupinus albus]
MILECWKRSKASWRQKQLSWRVLSHFLSFYYSFPSLPYGGAGTNSTTYTLFLNFESRDFHEEGIKREMRCVCRESNPGLLLGRQLS